MSQVVLLTDLKAHSALALSYALQLAERAGGGLLICHTARKALPNASDAEKGMALNDFMQYAEPAIDARFARQVSHAHGQTGNVLIDLNISYTHLPKPDPAKMHQLLSQKNAQLLVLDADNDRSKWINWWSGTSLLNKLIQYKMPCPLLSIPPHCNYRELYKMVYVTALRSTPQMLQSIKGFQARFDLMIDFLHVQVEETRSFSNLKTQYEQLLARIYHDQILAPKLNLLFSDAVSDTLSNFALENESVQLLALSKRPRNKMDTILFRDLVEDLCTASPVPTLVFFPLSNR